MTKQDIYIYKYILCLNKPFTMDAYIDVTFALNPVSKLHSGMMVFVGSAIVYVA